MNRQQSLLTRALARRCGAMVMRSGAAEGLPGAGRDELAAARDELAEPVVAPVAAPPALMQELRSRLLGGETHYTTRPGVIELREQLAHGIRAAGGPALDAEEEIIITAGGGEALFVTLLGLGATVGTRLAAPHGSGRHASLFALLGVRIVAADTASPAESVEATSIVYNDDPSRPAVAANDSTVIVNVAGLAFDVSARTWPENGPRTVAIGNLDSLAGMESFRIGYVAGPSDIVKKIKTWKQAFSICTAAPSQRAAIWTLANDPERLP